MTTIILHSKYEDCMSSFGQKSDQDGIQYLFVEYLYILLTSQPISWQNYININALWIAQKNLVLRWQKDPEICFGWSFVPPYQGADNGVEWKHCSREKYPQRLFTSVRLFYCSFLSPQFPLLWSWRLDHCISSFFIYILLLLD